MQEFLGELLDRPAGDRPFRIIEALPAAIYTTDADGRIQFYNRAAVELWGREPALRDEHWCGSLRLFTPDGRPLPHDECPMARALKSGTPIRGAEAVAERPDGRRVTFLAYPTPLLDETGTVSGAVNMLVDVTERKCLETARDRQIIMLRAVSELGMTALASDDMQALFDEAVARLGEGLDVEYAKVLELRPDRGELLLRSGVGWQDGLVGKATVGTELASQAGYTLSVNGPVVVGDLATETRFSGPALLHEHGVVSGLSVIIAGSGGRAFGVLGAHTTAHREFTSDDVNFLQSVANVLASAVARSEFRLRQATLLGEFAHRIKNNLSVIQSIARQCARHTDDVDEFAARLESQLGAIARSHELLTDSNWSGASLGELVDSVVVGQMGAAAVACDLDAVRLTADATQALTLVLHELMTNAAKYGALASGQGRISLVGRREEGAAGAVYRLEWLESGGPPVTKPARRGFGTRLVDNLARQYSKDGLEIDWRPQGVAIAIVLSLDAITGAR
jgi:PAS domain S-box-containing protein